MTANSTPDPRLTTDDSGDEVDIYLRWYDAGVRDRALHDAGVTVPAVDWTATPGKRLAQMAYNDGWRAGDGDKS